MGDYNTTGTPGKLYELGRGALYFSELDANGNPGAWRDLGNSPKFNLKLTSSEIEHMSSRQGVKTVDAAVTIERKITGQFDLDDLDLQNIAMLFGGTAYTAQTNAAVAGFSEYAMVTSVELGRWYDIVNSSGVRAYDVLTADLTVEKSGSPDTTLVEGTDYELDEDMGRIFLKSTASNIAAGDQLDVTLAARAGAKTLHVVKALNKTSISGALKFISKDPSHGNRSKEYQLHKVTIRPAADYELVGETWLKAGFEFTAYESASTRYTASPTLTITTHDNANVDGEA